MLTATALASRTRSVRCPRCHTVVYWVAKPYVPIPLTQRLCKCGEILPVPRRFVR